MMRKRFRCVLGHTRQIVTESGNGLRIPLRFTELSKDFAETRPRIDPTKLLSREDSIV